MHRRVSRPPPSDAPLAAFGLLGVKPDCTRRQLDAAFRRLAKAVHPDKGGDPRRFQRLQEAHAEVSAWWDRTRGRDADDRTDEARPAAGRPGVDAGYQVKVQVPLPRPRTSRKPAWLGAGVAAVLVVAFAGGVWRWTTQAPFRRLLVHRATVSDGPGGGLAITTRGPGVPSAWDSVLALGDRVTSLDLSFRTIDREMLEGIASLKNLQALDLSWSTANDDAADALAALPHLTELRLDGVPITAEGVTRLYRSPTLRRISLLDSAASYGRLPAPPPHVVVQTGDSLESSDGRDDAQWGPVEGIVHYVEPDQAALRLLAASSRDLGGYEYGLRSEREAWAEEAIFAPDRPAVAAWGDELLPSLGSTEVGDGAFAPTEGEAGFASPWSTGVGAESFDPSRLSEMPESFLQPMNEGPGREPRGGTRTGAPLGLPSSLNDSLLTPNLGADAARFNDPGNPRTALRGFLPPLSPPSHRPTRSGASAGVYSPWAVGNTARGDAGRLPWERGATGNRSPAPSWSYRNRAAPWRSSGEAPRGSGGANRTGTGLGSPRP